MVRNVLLMLASRQPPPPVEEVQWHADHCTDHETTHVITTRTFTEMVPGQSVVAFYGDKPVLDNEYLGKGVYLGYVALEYPARAAFAPSQRLSTPHTNIPENALGIHPFGARQEVAQPGEDLDSPQRYHRGQRPTTNLANIPDSPRPACRCITFMRRMATRIVSDRRKHWQIGTMTRPATKETSGNTLFFVA